MYDVDFIFGILVSWIRMIWGSNCSFLVSCWIPGKLVFMHPVFHVIIFRVWVCGLCGIGSLGGVCC